MKRERVFYLDFVRAFATIIIVLTHYNALYIYNVYPAAPEKAVISTTFAGVYIGSFGVSLFLILSGAALMYVYEEKIDVIQFYKKRFLNIYPMYWIAFFCAFLYNFYIYNTIPQGIPKRNIILSILGIDTYMANFGIITFATVGEWFIGLIIVIYVIFPLLRKYVIEHPILLCIFVVIMNIVSVQMLGRNILLFARLPEFIFGMIFVRYIKKVNWKYVIVCIVTLAYLGCTPPPINEIYRSLLVAISMFIILVWISYQIKVVCIKNICARICKYSYPCFLVHHFVIYKIAEKFDLNNITIYESWLLFFVCCVFVMIASVMLDRIYTGILKLFNEENGENYGVIKK